MAPAAGGGKAPKEDPAEKIQRMISEGITAAMGERDRTEREAKDPWARIEGMIDRTIAKHFEAFAKGLEEGMDSTGGKDKDKGGDAGGEGEGDDLITQLFGGGRK